MHVLAVFCLLFGLIRCSPVPTSGIETLKATQKEATALTDEQLKEQGVELMKKFANISLTASEFTKLAVPADSEDLRAANISMTCVVLKRVVEKIKEDYRNDSLYRDAIEISLNETTSKMCQDPILLANYPIILAELFTIPLMMISRKYAKEAIENSFEEYLKLAKSPEVRKYFEENLAVIRTANITKMFENGKKVAHDKVHAIHNEQHESLTKAMNVYWNKKEHTDEGKKIIEALTPERKKFVQELLTFEVKLGSALNKKIQEKIEQQMTEALEKKKVSLDLLKLSLQL